MVLRAQAMAVPWCVAGVAGAELMEVVVWAVARWWLRWRCRWWAWWWAAWEGCGWWGGWWAWWW